MKVSDYFVQGRRGSVRLHEKGGKEHEVPCHHKLEDLLDAYITGAGLAGDPDQPLFQTAAGKAGVLSGKPLWQQDAYRIIQRRAAVAGIETKIGNHTFRATGIYRVPQERRHTRKRATDCQSRVAAHDKTV